jgi:hypothetical protein
LDSGSGRTRLSRKFIKRHAELSLFSMTAEDSFATPATEQNKPRVQRRRPPMAISAVSTAPADRRGRRARARSLRFLKAAAGLN